MSRVRDAKSDAPMVWLVTPTGRPVKHPYGPGFTSQVIRTDEGRPVLRPSARDKGWRFMQDACSPAEWTAWCKFAEQESRSKGRLRIADKYKPKCLLERKSTRQRNAREYVPEEEDKPKSSKAGAAPQKSE